MMLQYLIAHIAIVLDASNKTHQDGIGNGLSLHDLQLIFWMTKILLMEYMMGPTGVLVLDPCPLNLAEMLTGAHIT